MNKPLNQAQSQRADGEAEYFNLHASGCGYLSRVRWVTPKGRGRGGRTGETFLACAINALRGKKDDFNYTYFDLRVSGEEAITLIEQLQEAVDDGRKVFIAFKLGDFYAHPYERDEKDDRGRPTGRKEAAALIKGRLLLVSHAQVDGETVYQRKEDEAGNGQESRQQPQVQHDEPQAQSADDEPSGEVEQEEPQARPAQRTDRPRQAPVADRSRVRSYQPAARH